MSGYAGVSTSFNPVASTHPSTPPEPFRFEVEELEEGYLVVFYGNQRAYRCYCPSIEALPELVLPKLAAHKLGGMK